MLRRSISVSSVRPNIISTYNPYKIVGIPPADRPTKRMKDIPPKTLRVSQPTLIPLHSPKVLGSSVLGLASERDMLVNFE
jgi:hypothetical protein